MEIGKNILSPTTGRVDQIEDEAVSDQDNSFDNNTTIVTQFLDLLRPPNEDLNVPIDVSDGLDLLEVLREHKANA